ncbi:putative redoxin [Helianthus debilis subsp. tardiflorus]
MNPKKLLVHVARTESKGVSLGSRTPYFELEEPLSGNMWKLDDFESYPAILVMFICNHCPFVKHLKKDIVKLTNLYMKKGLGVVAIPSNSIVTHPQDGPVFMAEDARTFNYPFPYLYDPVWQFVLPFIIRFTCIVSYVHTLMGLAMDLCRHKMLKELMELFAHLSFTSLKRYTH